jgi:hypothetical protein
MPLLFSYGTLQQEAVQITTFGRRLRGHPDVLVNFELSTLKIEDKVRRSEWQERARDRDVHREDDHRVSGIVFE